MFQHPITMQELGRQHQQELLQQASRARLARQVRLARRRSSTISVAKGVTRHWWWRLIHPRRFAQPVARPAAVVGPT